MTTPITMSRLRHPVFDLSVTAVTLLCAAATVAAAEPIPVTAKPVSELVIYPELRAPATVLSLNTSRLSAEISGRIIDIPVAVGQHIDSGAVLVRLDDIDYQLALERARSAAQVTAARIDQAQYELERAQTLAAKQLVSEQLLVQRQTELKTLQAEQAVNEVAIRVAQRDLTRTLLTAPFDAIVAARLGHVGELAAPGTPLLEIVDAGQLEVSATVQSELADALGSATKLQLLANNTSYPLRLRVVTPLIDNRSRTREARLIFTGARALPGSAGELAWRNHQAYLPAELLVKRNGRIGIFRINDNRAEFVALDHAEEGRPARSHLKGDTLVILEGRFRLQDGVEVVKQ